MKTHRFSTRALCLTAVLGALGAVLMFLDLSVPLMPGFIKLDFSELPALVAAFAYGPLAGVAVCLVKNLIHLLVTSTGGVGELANFLLGAVFAAVTGLIYAYRHDRRGALVAASAGAAAMAVVSVVVNYFLIYPLYARMMISMEAILGMYRAVDPGLTGLMPALLKFNLPFTFLKGMADTALCFLVYKRLSPLLHRTGKKAQPRPDAQTSPFD